LVDYALNGSLKGNKTSVGIDVTGNKNMKKGLILTADREIRKTNTDFVGSPLQFDTVSSFRDEC
jgi:hypothetical protein